MVGVYAGSIVRGNMHDGGALVKNGASSFIVLGVIDGEKMENCDDEFHFAAAIFRDGKLEYDLLQM